MELLDKVQFTYDTTDQDVKDLTDGEWLVALLPLYR